MARVLIVGGGCRGRRLASAIIEEGLTARITTRSEAGRAAIESCGAECFIGDPARLVTMRSSLEHVTIACWLLAAATGSVGELRALNSSRLERFLAHAIDTTVRGFIYETGDPAGDRPDLAEGARIVRALAPHNAIPTSFLVGDPLDSTAWLDEARAAVHDLLAGGAGPRA